MAQRHSLNKGVVSALTFKLTPVRHHTTMLTDTMAGFYLHLVESICHCGERSDEAISGNYIIYIDCFAFGSR